jgi:RNA polymerase sigma-70 factor (ECF subfamily)
VALSEIDRNLLTRCLADKPGAWRDFVDRYMGLVVHVVNHTASSRSLRLAATDREDLVAEVLLALIDNNYAVLRHFRGNSSLATYLTVVARRVVVRSLMKGTSGPTLSHLAHEHGNGAHTADSAEERMADVEQVERLLQSLERSEADVVRMYHLEGLSYDQISRVTGMPSGSVGPILSRARSKMRLKADPTAT